MPAVFESTPPQWIKAENVVNPLRSWTRFPQKQMASWVEKFPDIFETCTYVSSRMDDILAITRSLVLQTPVPMDHH